MKKLWILAFVILSFAGYSQDYQILKDYLHSHYPQIDLENKIIVLNVWESSNTASRDLNKEIQRVANIYQGAKLKGGPSGAVFVSICADKTVSSFQISSGKDQITTPALICDEKGFGAGILGQLHIAHSLNTVYDSHGTVIYSNLQSSNVFLSFNQLITR